MYDPFEEQEPIDQEGLEMALSPEDDPQMNPYAEDPTLEPDESQMREALMQAILQNQAEINQNSEQYQQQVVEENKRDVNFYNR
jgi:hypothetical protein